MNAERFVRFVERVEQTMVAYGRGGKYYDIVSEHLFLRLADGMLVVRMNPKEGGGSTRRSTIDWSSPPVRDWPEGD